MSDGPDSSDNVPDSSDNVPLVRFRPSRIPSQSDEATTSEMSQSEDSSSEPLIRVSSRQPTRQMEATPKTSPSDGDAATGTPSDEIESPGASAEAEDTSPEPPSLEEEFNNGVPDADSGLVRGPNRGDRPREGMLMRPHRQGVGPADVAGLRLQADGEEGNEQQVAVPPPQLPVGGWGPPGMYRYRAGAEGLEEIMLFGAEQIGSSNWTRIAALMYLILCIVVAGVVSLVVLLINYLLSYAIGHGSSGNETDTT